jgi:small-conductance mechanosensitive channel
LFYINDGIGAFTAHERATAITEKIRNVAKNKDGYRFDSLTVSVEGNVVGIACRDVIIMVITETDAALAETTQMALALEYEKAIQGAIIQHQKDTAWLTILLRVLAEVLIIAVQFFLIKIINRLFRRISDRVRQMKGKVIKTIKIKSYKLLDEEKTISFILFLLKIARYLIIFITLYQSILLALSVFPATRGIAGILFGYVLTPLKTMFYGIVGFIPNLITIIIIILVFRYLIRGLRFFAEEIDKGRLTLKGFYPDWAHPTFNIVKTLLYVFMFIIIFPLLPNSDSKIFQGVSIFIGVVFSLSSSSIINNVISGLVLTYMRPFKVGDRIKIGEIVGNVIEKTPFVTRIRTPKNEEVTIPNSTIMSAQTFNYSQSARTCGLVLHTELTFGYDTPWKQVHELLLNAAKRTPNIMETPKPFILQTALDDFYAEYQLNVYINDADKMPRVYSDLHQNIQDTFNEAGLDLLSPHYQICNEMKMEKK